MRATDVAGHERCVDLTAAVRHAADAVIRRAELCRERDDILQRYRCGRATAADLVQYRNIRARLRFQESSVCLPGLPSTVELVLRRHTELVVDLITEATRAGPQVAS